MHSTVGLLLALAASASAFAPAAVPMTGARSAAVSAKGRVQLRSSVGSAAHLAPMALRKSSFAQTSFTVRSETELSAAVNSIQMALKDGQKPIVIGLAADSGCGKSTFMRRVTALFGGECKLNDIGRETNTLISDMTTVICLDDFHSNDRAGRKVSGLTALDPRENDFDNMLRCVKELKEGKSVMEPIYNHVNGTLDEDEEIKPTPIIIFEGLHPFYDDRVNELMDFRIYVDITPETKFNWKVQRDVEERGWTVDQVKEQIQAREPDFNAYIDPQKEKADCIIQVLPTEMAKDDKKHLKVEMIQVKGVKNFKPTYILDADGEMTKVEAAFADASTKSAGEATEKMCGYEGQPGSNDGTGFFQTITALKCREIYEALSGAKVAA